MLDRRRKLKPVLISGPAAPIMSVTEAKQHLRVDHSDDDPLITGLIAAVTSYLDKRAGILGRALITQTWRQDYYYWPNSYNGLYIPISSNAYDYPWQYNWSPYTSDYGLRLPLTPVQSVTSVKYYDANNVQQTVGSQYYGLYDDDLGPFVRLDPKTFNWPQINVNRPDAISVTFVAGQSATNLDEGVKMAAKLLLGHWYENREAVGDKAMAEVPLAFDALISNLWRPSI